MAGSVLIVPALNNGKNQYCDDVISSVLGLLEIEKLTSILFNKIILIEYICLN